MAPRTLLDLPPELLIPIVSLVRENGPCSPGSWGRWTSPSSQTSLASIAITCKTLNAIAIPILYFAPSTVCNPYLLRTLIERPDLASLVRALDLKTRRNQDARVVPYSDEVFAAMDIAAIKATTRRLKLRIPRMWFGGIEYPEVFREYSEQINLVFFDIILALVANNIEAVRYTALNCVKLDGIVTPSPLTGCDLVFPCLKFLAMSGWDQEDLAFGWDLALRSDLLRICPNLESLWLHRCANIPGKSYHLPNLRSLRLSSCTFGLPSMKVLLQACPVLEEFGFFPPTCYDTSVWVPEDEEFYMRDVVQLLKPMAGTLRRLVLEPSDEYLDAESEGEAASLVEFPLLETLLVHPSYFDTATIFEPLYCWIDPEVMFDTLPKGLTCFAISATDGWSCAASTILAQGVDAGIFPNLRKVILGRLHYTEPKCNFRAHITGEAKDCEMFAAPFAASGTVQYIEHSWDENTRLYLPTYDFSPGESFLRPQTSHW